LSIHVPCQKPGKAQENAKKSKKKQKNLAGKNAKHISCHDKNHAKKIFLSSFFPVFFVMLCEAYRAETRQNAICRAGHVLLGKDTFLDF